MTPHLHYFQTLSPFALCSITTADDTPLPVLGSGTVLLQTDQGSFRLDNVQFVLGLTDSLLSTSALEKAGYGINSSRKGRFVYHETDPTTTSSSH